MLGTAGGMGAIGPTRLSSTSKVKPHKKVGELGFEPESTLFIFLQRVGALHIVRKSEKFIVGGRALGCSQLRAASNPSPLAPPTRVREPRPGPAPPRPALSEEPPLLPGLGGARAESGWLRAAAVAAAVAAAAAGSELRLGPDRSEFEEGTPADSAPPTRGNPFRGTASRPAPPSPSRSGGPGARGGARGPGNKGGRWGNASFPRPHPAGLLGER